MQARTFSSSINAYSLMICAKKLGIELYTIQKETTYPMSVNSEISNKNDWLLFTEESSLRLALENKIKGKFYPDNYPIDLLDNKLEFNYWIKNTFKDIYIPKQWRLDELDNVQFPCILKAKHSWNKSTKLPRGWVCKDKNILLNKIKYLELQSFNKDFFFIQQWLGENCIVISVCGFFDWTNQSRNLTAVVQRLSSQETGLSCSSIVETITDKWKLKVSSFKILKALKFIGPYELEFIIMNDSSKLIELNPRFWMQNAIFLNKGNGLVKRYFNMDEEIDHITNEISDIIWIDSFQFVKNLFMFRCQLITKILKCYFVCNKEVMMWPPLRVTFVAFLKIALVRFLSKGLRLFSS